MPYKDKITARIMGRIRMRKWRVKNKEKERARRKFLRDTQPTTKAQEKRYYRKNIEKILRRGKKYNEANKQKRKKQTKKDVVSGKTKRRGKKDRMILKKHYIASLIKSDGSNKSISEKQVEVLIYRLKKMLKLISSEK